MELIPWSEKEAYEYYRGLYYKGIYTIDTLRKKKDDLEKARDQWERRLLYDESPYFKRDYDSYINSLKAVKKVLESIGSGIIKIDLNNDMTQIIEQTPKGIISYTVMGTGENICMSEKVGESITLSEQDMLDLLYKTQTRNAITTKAIEHCIATDWDLITAEYDSWDDYLMETLGCSEEDVLEMGIELADIF